MTPEQRKIHVAANTKRRGEIQVKIRLLTSERSKYVAEWRKKHQPTTRSTLDAVMIQAIRSQATARKFTFKQQ